MAVGLLGPTDEKATVVHCRSHTIKIFILLYVSAALSTCIEIFFFGTCQYTDIPLESIT